MNSRNPIAAILLFVLGIHFPLLGRSENHTAWKLLLENKPLEASEAFKKNKSHKDPAVAGEAFRGQGLTARMMGLFQDEVRFNFESFRRDKDTIAFLAGTLRRLPFDRFWESHRIEVGYDVLRDLSSHPSLPTAAASLELSRRLANDGEYTKSEALLRESGILRKWWAIGPFSNISGSGINAPYPPESNQDLSKTYLGKKGNTVHWFPLEVAPPSTWLFTQNHLPAANAILYFSTQVESPQDRGAVLAFGASGSFKVFLNGRLVLADRKFRNTGEDAFLQDVQLRKGPNRILIKLGNEDRYSNFLLRFLRPDGRGMSDLRETRPEGTYPHVGGEESRLLRNPVLDRLFSNLHGRLDSNPDDMDAATLLMDLYNGLEMTDSGEVFAMSVLRRNPKAAIWHQMLAETLTRSRQTTRSGEHLKTCFRNSALCHPGWALELDRLTKESGAEAVLEFMKGSAAGFQETNLALFSKMGALMKLDRQADALQLISKLEKSSDFNQEAATVLASIYLNQGRGKENKSVWEKYFRHETDNSGSYMTAAEHALKRGETEEAIRVLEKGRKYLPMNPDLPLTLARVHLNADNLPAAEKAVSEALSLCPNSGLLLSLKGSLLAASGRKREALDILHRSIASNYNDFASWDKVMELEGKPSFESLAPLPSIDSLLEAARTWPALQREQGAILSYIQDVFFYPSRAVRERTFLAIHLPTQEAVNQWKEYSISYNPSYQEPQINRMLTRKAGGNEINAEIHGRNVIFKSLEPGDAIILEWSLKNDFDGDMARQAWGRMPFRLNLPCFDSRLRLFSSGRDTIGYTVRGANITKSASERAGVGIRTFSRGPFIIPTYTEYLPANDATTPDVLYSTFSDWGRIADWYANLTENKTAPAPILRRMADSLFQGAASDSERVAKVQAFVATSIAYSSLPFRQSGWIPQEAQEVLASRLGDCKDKAALAKSLLNLAGVESRLVLVSTRGNDNRPGPIGPYFDHCILMVKLNGKEFFLELTDPNLPWKRLPKMDQGALALVVERGNRSLVRLPEEGPADRSITRTVTARLEPSGAATFSSRTVRTGSHATHTRNSYRFFSEPERRQTMRKALGEDFADLALDSLQFSSMDPGADSVSYTYSFRVPRVVNVSGKTRIFGLYSPDKLMPPQIPAPEYDSSGIDLFRFSYNSGTYSLLCRMEIPATWKIMAMPQPTKLKSPFGEYSLTFQIMGNVLTYRRRAVFDFRRDISPRETAEARTFLSKVVEADGAQLIFVNK